jgi:hypothetical protein
MTEHTTTGGAVRATLEAIASSRGRTLEDVADEAQERGYPYTLDVIARDARSGFVAGVGAVLGLSTDERANLVDALWTDLDALQAKLSARRPAGAEGDGGA